MDIEEIKDFVYEVRTFGITSNDTKFVQITEYLLSELEKQQKEIEELKEKNKPQPDCAEPIERTEEMVNMRWVNHNYILKSESEQKEKQAYIDGTNAAHELCNKKWEDKIKAKIEELEIEQESNREDLKIAIDNLLFQNIDKIGNKMSINMSVRGILQSLLEKE